MLVAILSFQSTTSFGSQTGGSIFGGTSTPTFGTSSTPVFGSSTPAFGSSVIGQKPAFGGFGLTPSQTNPFGSNLFGFSTPFSGSSEPAFGATSTPAFGAATTPALGGTGMTLGVSSAPEFGSGGAFGTSSTPSFGSSSTLHVVLQVPAFGASSTPSFSFGSTPVFGQTMLAFGSNPFGTSLSSSPFGAHTYPFGDQATVPTFGSTGLCLSIFGGQCGGSRVASYTPTPEVDGGSDTQPAGKLESISAMPIYKDKSHEELRGEDYQLREKGGPNPCSESTSGFGFGARAVQSSLFGPSPTFGQSSTNIFSSSSSSHPFASKTPTFGSSGFGDQATTPTFGSIGLCLSIFGGQCGGSRVASYTPTPEVDGGSDTQPAGKLESISAMPIYKDKSHEELRGEDYQLREKGGPNPYSESTSGFGFGARAAQSGPFGPSPTFGQSSTNLFSSSSSSNPFASMTPTLGSLGIGDQATTPTFGSTGLCLSISGGQCGGSKVASYTPTPEVEDGSNTQPAGELESISAMPIYKDKSHEELRGEDYQLREKGGPNPYSESTSGFGFGARAAQSSPFGPSPTFGQSSTNQFSNSSSDPFASKTPAFGSSGFGDKTTAHTFGSSGLCLSIFGGQCGGSKVASYTPTPEVNDCRDTQPAGKLESISAMPIYKDKSHEELRVEDYQLREKGGPNPYSESTSGFGFGARVAQSCPFGPSPTFGQSSTNHFSSSSSSDPFTSKTPVFGSSGFGDQASASTFGSTGLCLSIFGGQCRGSRVASYTPTPEVDGGSDTQPAGKLESISAMAIYKDKSHEELRWEDYQLREKGGPNPYNESTSGFGFGAHAAQSGPFCPSPTFGHSSTNQFSSSSSDPFASKTLAFGSSGFGVPSTPAFGSSSFGSSS